MSGLPAGWVVSYLDQIANVLDYERQPINSSERAQRTLKTADKKLYPYYGATGQVGWIDGFRSEGQRILLGEDGAPFLDQYKDKAFLVNGKYWVNNHAHILEGAFNLMDNTFLCHQLNTIDFHPYVSGTTRLKLTNSAMKQIALSVPPAAEQTRIVAKLDALLTDLDAGVAQLKAAQKKLVQYRQSLLKAAVEGTLTAEWRSQQTQPQETGEQLLKRILTERRSRWQAKQLVKYAAQGKPPPKDWQSKYPEPVKPDTSALAVMPQGWVWASADMLGELMSGVTKGTQRNESIVVREVPYLRVANVQRGYLDLTEIKSIYATENDILDLTLLDGDVLFNEGGDRDKLGRGWVWRNEVANCIHQNHVYRLRPCLPELESELISHHSNTFGKRWFEKTGKQTTNLASISMGVLRAFPVPVAPALEQKAIVSMLREQLVLCQEQTAAIEIALKQSAAQRKNILKAAFAGELVPQDPSDEPASALLARIAAQRAVNSSVKRVKHSRKGIAL